MTKDQEIKALRDMLAVVISNFDKTMTQMGFERGATAAQYPLPPDADELDAVAAENVALKERESRLLKNIHEDLGDTDFHLAALETPATDAIINALRAEGIQMLLDSLPPYYTARGDIERRLTQLRNGEHVGEEGV